MRFLASCLHDEELREALEADFQHEYQIDLFTKTGELTDKESLRRIVVLTNQLPENSRIMRQVTNDPLDKKDHFLMNVTDLLRRIDFYSQVTARGTISAEDSDVFDSTPKPLERPQIKYVEKLELELEKPHFVSGRELAESFADGAITTKEVKDRTRAAREAQE